jgi:hypothetical protein
MRQRFIFAFGSSMVLALILVFSSAITAQGAQHQSSLHYSPLQATPPSELPPDTKILELDKPITDSLEPEKPGRFYKFDAKADQLLRLSIEPKSTDLFAMITILDSDLQTILGGTQGEALLGGSIILRVPANGTYVVSVDYSDMMIGTPTAGSFDVTLSEFKLK